MVRLRISYHTMTNLFRRCYGVLDPLSGFFNVSVDGSVPQRLSAKNSVGLYQSMLWSNTSLGPGRHTVTITNVDESLQQFQLDFFRSVTDDVR